MYAYVYIYIYVTMYIIISIPIHGYLNREHYNIQVDLGAHYFQTN